ncbi:MAG TPA: N-acetyltransferase [Methylomirabilota bacterium]
MTTTRPEHPDDAAAVGEVHTAAFGRPDEARLVERLRARARPYLALVATAGDEVVGHIVFAPVTLHCYQAPYTILALSPMAVRPAWQRRGIGSALVRDGLAACRASGHDVVVLVGHPAFYPRFGFVPARPLGLLSEPAFPEEAFMVAELTPGALRGRRGVVLFSSDYGEPR